MGKIEDALVVGVTVNRAHETVLDAECAVQNFGQWRETIGRAAGVRNNGVLRRIVNVIVDADAKSRDWIFRRRGYEPAFRTALADMQLSLIAVREKAGGFQHNIDIQLFPRQCSRILL